MSNHQQVTKTSRQYNSGMNLLREEEQRLLKLKKIPSKPLSQRHTKDVSGRPLASERSFGSLPSIPEVGPTDHILRRGFEGRSGSQLIIAGEVVTKSPYNKPISTGRNS